LIAAVVADQHDVDEAALLQLRAAPSSSDWNAASGIEIVPG
jgi:hypothetical protein